MKKRIWLVVFLMMFVMGLIGCSFGPFQDVPYSKLEYFGNGNTSGTVPVDKNGYGNGEKAIVAQHGDLAKVHHAFKHWNTKADDSGISYAPGSEYGMHDMKRNHLYAIWEI